MRRTMKHTEKESSKNFDLRKSVLLDAMQIMFGGRKKFRVSEVPWLSLNGMGPGTVKVVVSGPEGSAVSEDVLQAVEDYIVSPDDRSKRLCPIGAEVTIATVTESTIAYSAIIEVKTGIQLIASRNLMPKH